MCSVDDVDNRGRLVRAALSPRFGGEFLHAFSALGAQIVKFLDCERVPDKHNLGGPLLGFFARFEALRRKPNGPHR